MKQVRAKKHLGQHFLIDTNIAQKIVESITNKEKAVIEIGPGMGVLTQYLIQKSFPDFYVVEIDKESVVYLTEKFPELKNKIIDKDFLKYNLEDLFSQQKIQIVGNFPYNISTQILFKVYDNRNKVDTVVGMFQKEVAQRIASPPGNKTYGILSVLLQAFYDIEYLFTVDENVFNPPPKVKSGVIKLSRNTTISLDCNEILFKKIIKTAFNQRRKVISNSLKIFNFERTENIEKLLRKRPEQLHYKEFIVLTNAVIDK